MSLLEDVFLHDEAGEAQELERIIDGDEYDERPRAIASDSDDNIEKEDEAEEDKRRVEPASTKPKRVVKNPRIVLNPARLTGPRGIQVIPEHFKDFKFKGKGHEKEDLDLVLKNLEHWAYRLFPKFQFADCLKKIETLGNKRPVMVHLTKIRTDQFLSEETVVQRESSDDEALPEPVQEEDEFDKLLQQQIELARATPAPGSTRKPAFSTPVVNRTISMPKATSSPSINEEQRERMLRNRQMAEERRLSRLKQNTSETSIQESTNNVPKDPDTITNDNPVKDVSNLPEVDTVEENGGLEFSDDVIDEDVLSKVKNNRYNVIDSSDEDDALVINESVTVDVHNSHRDACEEEIQIVNRNKIIAIEDTEEISDMNDVAMNDVIEATEENNIDSRNKNTIIENTEEISDINDVAMNDVSEATKENNIDSRNKSTVNENTEEISDINDAIKAREDNKVNSRLDISETDDNSAELDNPDKIEVISDVCNDKSIKEIAKSDVNTLESGNSNHRELLKKNGNENNHADDSNKTKDEQTKAPQEIEEIDQQGVEKENDVEDIMDIDFSDDF